MSKKQNIAAPELPCRDLESGLYNYNHFRHALEQELARLDRWGRPLSLAVIRAMGITDRTWPCFSGILCSCLRRIDLAARLGEAEAVVILPDADEYKARQWLTELVAGLEEEKMLQGVIFSYGFALTLPWEGKPGDELLAIAANNLVHEKNICPADASAFSQHSNSAIAAEEKSLLFDGFKALENSNKH